jgi:hypothetical protein
VGLAQALDRNGVPNTLVEVPGDEHVGYFTLGKGAGPGGAPTVPESFLSFLGKHLGNPDAVQTLTEVGPTREETSIENDASPRPSRVDSVPVGRGGNTVNTALLLVALVSSLTAIFAIGTIFVLLRRLPTRHGAGPPRTMD